MKELPSVQVTTVHKLPFNTYKLQRQREQVFYIYNTKADCDKLIGGIDQSKGVFQWHFQIRLLYMAVVAAPFKHPYHQGQIEMLDQIQLNNPT